MNSSAHTTATLHLNVWDWIPSANELNSYNKYVKDTTLYYVASYAIILLFIEYLKCGSSEDYRVYNTNKYCLCTQ